MAELILGIDDAGRGPVIGPMVLAGCLINKDIEKDLKKAGVRDSKQLTQKRREFLSNIIKEKAETFEIVLSNPVEIDDSLNNGTNLNKLEAQMTGEIINRINKGYKKIKVVVDCPSVSLEKWKDILRKQIKDLSTLEISCEHKADKNHLAVSAASILAKCVREQEMAKLKEKFGDEIGSGYTSDPLTQRYLEKNAEKHKDSGIFRKTWETWKRAFSNLSQRTL
jgi:ribonuclease HII